MTAMSTTRTRVTVPHEPSAEKTLLVRGWWGPNTQMGYRGWLWAGGY